MSDDHTEYEDVEAWLDSVDPATLEFREAVHFRRIIAARQALAQAVAEARKAGDPWTIIGAALDTSARTAWERYGQPGEEPPAKPKMSLQEVIDQQDEFADRFENGSE